MHIIKHSEKGNKLWQQYTAQDAYICIREEAFGTADAERAIFMTKQWIPIGVNAAIITMKVNF